MSLTYRAAYYWNPDDQSSASVVLTTPEHADLPNEKLLQEAMRFGQQADWLGEEPGIFAERIRIGEWRT